jgi:glycosyltransferase involved in cell wall biosynthesis
VTAARLTGIREASGDWIGFVDGDDYIEPDMYERLLKNARRYQADISHCGYQMVFPSRTDYYYNTGHLVCQDTQKGIRNLLEGKFIEPGLCNKLFRRSLFNEILDNDLMDLTIKNNEDLLMNYYLFSGSDKSVYEDFCPYHYMVRAGSAATSPLNENKLRDPLKVLNIISKDLGDKKELKQIVDKRRIALLISQATLVSNDNQEKILLHRCAVRKELRKLAFDTIRGNFSIKQKIQVIWVSIWPWSYGMVHLIYAKLTGLDKKYSVE